MDFELPYMDLLPIQAIEVTLIFEQDYNTAFFHMDMVDGFVRSVFNRQLLDQDIEFDQYFSIEVIENGCSQYAQGQLYRFAVYCFNAPHQWIQHLLDQLHKLSASIAYRAARNKQDILSSQTVNFVEVTDLFTFMPVTKVEELMKLESQSLNREADMWLEAIENQRLTVVCRFISLLRMRVAKSGSSKSAKKFVTDTRQISAGLLQDRFFDTLYALTQRRFSTKRTPRANTHFFTIKNANLLNVVCKKEGGASGLIGSIELNFKCDNPLSLKQTKCFLSLLVFLQYLGFGARRAAGYGRFRLENLAGDYVRANGRAGQSLLERAFASKSLRAARKSIYSNIDKKQRQKYQSKDDEWVAGLAKMVQERRYTPDNLLGVAIRKKNGGYRDLSIPSFGDRVLQRALATTLNLELETLMSHVSYAYRKGKSRQQAIADLKNAYQQGYTTVFESDVSDFFDSVDRQYVFNLLDSLYPNDPAIVLCKQWMSVPIYIDGELLQRPKGLPQGSPLSPLLANLLLTDFDQDMRSAGFRLIRYADDFVVLCKDIASAKRALKEAELSLAQVGLGLHPQKTKLADLDNESINFLGYMVQQDSIIELNKPGKQGGSVKQTSQLTTALKKWLIRQKGKPIIKAEHETSLMNYVSQMNSKGRKNQSRQALPAKSNTPINSVASYVHEPSSDQKQTVFVSSDYTKISSGNERIVVKQDDIKLLEKPWAHIDQLILCGSHHLTAQAINESFAYGISVHFLSRGGKYKGSLSNDNVGRLGHQLWLKQLATFSNMTDKVELMAAIVEARVCNIKVAIEKIERQSLSSLHSEKIISRLDRINARLPYAKTPERIRAFEAIATKQLFSCLRANLQNTILDGMPFQKRQYRPSPDPVNTMLSVGYAILRAYIDSFIRIEGLLAQQGFAHITRGKDSALASDLMEPFRHVIELAVLDYVNNTALTSDDFEFNSDNTECRFSKKTFRQFSHFLTQKLDAPLVDQHKNTKLKESMHWQVRQLLFALDRDIKFQAWKAPSKPAVTN